MIEEKRKPFPPFNKETAIQKVRMAENAWNNRDQKRFPLPIQLTVSGETDLNLFRDVMKLLSFWKENGQESWSTV